MSSNVNPTNLYGPTIKGKPVFDKRFWKVKNHVQRMEANIWNSLTFKQRFIVINGKMSKLKARDIGNGIVEVRKGHTEK
ncbi:MAG: hypothetical protein RAP70_12035 [Candidatus Celaenobacter antarcticus]|nr:hypothetical protein [Candidatus Celaenobacter antarcticus]